jgi:hypothetical protein
MPEPAASIDEIPVCPGCGLMSHIEPAGICEECWHRRERRAGGGSIYIETAAGTTHETARCPGVQAASEWWHLREESCLYAELAGDLRKCVRCHQHSLFGFDEFRGEYAFQEGISHA